MKTDKPILEMKGITKRFPGITANDQIDFSLYHGEIHALMGENGAGKSTLMNILYGLSKPDSGEIFLHGKKVRISRPFDAISLGIGMVHQHFMLIPVMTVAENMTIGNELTHGGIFLDLKKASEKVRELSLQYGLEIDPGALISSLPVGTRQRVEILKLLFRKADILILDEPTAVLTPEESDKLFQTLIQLTKTGKSVIFITHKLKEVMRIADRITVLRNGRVAGVSKVTEKTSESYLASLMVGRDVVLRIDKKKSNPGEPVLQVNDLKAKDNHGAEKIAGISFKIRSGEIMGIAGVQGNGQTELSEVLTGLRKASSGEIKIREINITNRSPRFISECGIAHIPEDRHKYGMVGSYPISDNLILNSYYRKPFSQRCVISYSAKAENADWLINQFDIRVPNILTSAGNLSGGNQQKMVIAREFSRKIQLLIADQPTRGLDVGSIEFIHNQIVKKRDEGCAVLLISTELDEIIALADRICVMYKGIIIAKTDADKVSRAQIGLWMAGIK